MGASPGDGPMAEAEVSDGKLLRMSIMYGGELCLERPMSDVERCDETLDAKMEKMEKMGDVKMVDQASG